MLVMVEGDGKNPLTEKYSHLWLLKGSKRHGRVALNGNTTETNREIEILLKQVSFDFGTVSDTAKAMSRL